MTKKIKIYVFFRAYKACQKVRFEFLNTVKEKRVFMRLKLVKIYFEKQKMFF